MPEYAVPIPYCTLALKAPRHEAHWHIKHSRHLGTLAPWHFDYFPSYVAVTVVVIPPRAEKSPTTVMRRGRQAATRSSRI